MKCWIVGLVAVLGGVGNAWGAIQYIVTDLGNLGGTNATAAGINSSGQVVGSSNATGNNYHAFLYSGGSMQDLGTLGGAVSQGYAINNSGQVVGVAQTDNATVWYAFLYSGGSMQSLGTLPDKVISQAYGINNLGQVVGLAYSDNSGVDQHAFLYSDGVMQDLSNLIPSNSGWTLMQAVGINDSGQICGKGINPNGQIDAFLLTPNTVPEPSSIVVMGGLFATFGIGIWWRRRRSAKAA